MKRNPAHLPGLIGHFKDATLSLWKTDLPQGHSLDGALPAVEIADLELTSAKLFVVADTAQQFVDRLHGGYSRSGNCARGSRNVMERAWPGTRPMNPRSSRVAIVWWMAAGEVRKYRWMSPSAGGMP